MGRPRLVADEPDRIGEGLHRDTKAFIPVCFSSSAAKPSPVIPARRKTSIRDPERDRQGLERIDDRETGDDKEFSACRRNEP